MTAVVTRAAIPAAVLVVTLAACATSYDPDDEDSYRERRLSTAPPVYEVYFLGNRYSDPGRMRDFAMLRAAELALEAGFTHFLVTDSTSWAKTQRGSAATNVSVDADATRWPEAGDVAVLRMPTASPRYKTTVALVDGSEITSGRSSRLQHARETFDELTAKYGIKRAIPGETRSVNSE